MHTKHIYEGMTVVMDACTRSSMRMKFVMLEVYAQSHYYGCMHAHTSCQRMQTRSYFMPKDASTLTLAMKATILDAVPPGMHDTKATPIASPRSKPHSLHVLYACVHTGVYMCVCVRVCVCEYTCGQLYACAFAHTMLTLHQLQVAKAYP
jgi:hypothetical protein